jgi:predicted nucleic acid-binding protein
VTTATLVVPDASVLLKWALSSGREDDQERALALKAAWVGGGCEIVVPTLWVFEVGNVLGLKQPETAAPLLQAMLELGMREAPAARYSGAILGLMREHKVTFYDAAYHALAILEGGVMLTADRAYVRRASRAGHVELLSDWEPPSAATR